METRFDRAGPEDYDEVMDFGNYVFSQAHSPHDFPALLPKLYRREYFMDGIHYLAREGGRIRAAVGAYPLEWEFPGGVLPGRGIGMVSVHPYCRSRGYMQALMNTALEDMKRDGMVFSCLGGRRQRYEYFGYTPGGSVWSFSVNEANITHTLGRDWHSGLSLKSAGPGDGETLDRIRDLHEAKAARLRRERGRLFDILSSWKTEVFAVYEGSRFEGYFLAKRGGQGEQYGIGEINLRNFARLPEVLGLFLRLVRDRGAPGFAAVKAGPHETEKIAALSRFAEEYGQGPVYQFAVFDYPRFVDPFMKLRARDRVLAEGSFVLGIEGGPRLLLAVSGGTARAAETEAPADLRLDRLEAFRLLFSAPASLAASAVRESPFLQSLLPLPLFFEHADGV